MRDLDIIVFGATGDAGRAIAAYLARTAPPTLKWAVGGRSAPKLRDLLAALGSDVPIVLASCDDAASMAAMAGRTRLVLSAAGPYDKLGEPVLRACIENGTHYCDITGEVPWVAAMRAKYHEQAQAAGVAALSFCGYDCVPCELSVFTAAAALGSPLRTAECVTRNAGGAGMPTGTIKTALGMMVALPSFLHGWWHYLPAVERAAAAWSMVLWALPRYSAHVKAFTVPHFMGWCNTPVVHATAHALGGGGGSTGLRFQDRMVLWRGAASLRGLLPLLGLYAAALLLALPAALLTLLPAAGRAAIAALDRSQYSYPGSAAASVTVRTRATGAHGGVADVLLRCPGDPGIFCTALLAAEVARGVLEAGEPLPAGLSTPVAALGADALGQRLRRAGVRIEVVRGGKAQGLATPTPAAA